LAVHAAKWLRGKCAIQAA